MTHQQTIVLAAALFAASGLSHAQNKPNEAPADSGVIIRTETRLVLVDAIVTNKKHMFEVYFEIVYWLGGVGLANTSDCYQPTAECS